MYAFHMIVCCHSCPFSSILPNDKNIIDPTKCCNIINLDEGQRTKEYFYAGNTQVLNRLLDYTHCTEQFYIGQEQR
jgi:hypothetical protein